MVTTKLPLLYRGILVALLVSLFLAPLHVPVAAQERELDGKRIYFAESNREANPFDRSEVGLSRFSGMLQQLGADVLPLDWRRDIPEDADLVVIAGATRHFEAGQTARLWAYLHNGGSVLIVSDPLIVSEDEEDGTVIELNTSFETRRGLFELTWPNFGVRGRDDVILTEDAEQLEQAASLSASSVEAQALMTWFTASELVTDHPINTGIEGELQFFGARSVEYDASIQAYHATPLVFAPNNTYGETEYIDFLETGFVPTFSSADTNPHTLAVAVASENPTTQARLVVIGDGEFATNGGGMLTSPANSRNFVYPNNVLFLANTVAWLTDAAPVDPSQLIPDMAQPAATTPLAATVEPTEVMIPLTAIPVMLPTEEAAVDAATGTTN